MNHVLITGMNRSGTTLLLNLLDSHSMLLCLPVEVGIFRALANKKTNLLEVYRRGFDQLWMFLDSHTRLSESDFTKRGHPPNDWETYLEVMSLDLDFKLLKHSLRSNLLTENPDTSQKILLIIYRTFFPNIFSGLADYRYIVTKRPKSTFAIDCFFEHYPNGRVIYMSRRPDWAYASQKYSRLTNSEIQCDDYSAQIGAVMEYCEGWKKNYCHIMELQERYRDQIVVVELEDVAKDIKFEMAKVAKFLDITFEEILLSPTVMNNSVKGNTTQEGNAVQFNASIASGGREEILSEYDRAIFYGSLHRFCKKLGYYLPSVKLSFGKAVYFNAVRWNWKIVFLISLLKSVKYFKKSSEKIF